MSRLNEISEPYERDRGLSFAEDFSSSDNVTDNGGAETGTPTFTNGIVLDGTTDYVSYNSFEGKLDSASLSFVIRFTPDFNYNENVQRCLIDSGTAGQRHLVFKNNNAANNVLSITMGGTGIHSLSEAEYSAYWNVNEENVLVISATTGNTSAWLNGTKVLNADATAWSATNPTDFYAGINASKSTFWSGTIHEIKIFKSKLSDEEAVAYSNNTQADYMTGITLDMPLNMANYDPTNTQVLDISGNEHHGTIVASPIKSTFETGMYFNSSSSQYINIPTITDPITGDFTMSGFVKCRGHLGGTSDDYSTAFGCGDWSGTHVRGCCLRSQEASNQLKFDYGTGTSSGTKTIHNPFIPNYENRWIHVVLTYTSATTRVVVYSNGEVVSAATEAIGNTVGGDTYQIGASSGLNTGQDFWFGSLALIKFWDSRALTSMQVKKLYQDDLQELKRI